MATDHASTTAARGAIAPPGFELLSELGHGATTVVYRARRTGVAGPDVAVKMLRERTDDAAEVAALFRREAALLARVRHPSLAGVHAAGEAAGRPFLVLELVDGVALSELIADGPMPQDRVVGVAIDVAGALAAAHRMRLVHRDVKPQNLLVAADGRAMLIDFDLATWTGELAPADTVTGTLTYSAPEQTGMLTRPVDARSDLYALGVVLFECVTGRPPFASDDVGELLRLHAAAPAPDVRDARPDCAAGLAAVIAKLLAKDPDDRFQTATGLLADLRRLAEGPDGSPFLLDDSADSAAAAAADALPLVGREAELAALTASWERALSVGTQLALIAGTAGTGRTRLGGELAAGITRRGGTVLRGTPSQDRLQPLAAIGSAVRRHMDMVRRLPPEQREQAEQRLRDASSGIAPLLTGLSPALAALLDADDAGLPDDRQEQVSAATATFLTALAHREGGLLVVLDDAHLADAATERVLSHLFTDVEAAPLLLVLTAPDGAVAGLEARLGTPFDPRVTLEALTPPAVAELIAGELGGAHVPADVARQLASRTGGNPFAVLEFLRHLIEAGGLQPSWGTWLLDSDLLDRLHLPSDVLDLVLARLEGLRPAARRLLGAAAVQGMRFDVALLATSAPADVADVADAMAIAARSRIVEHVDGDVYTFVHSELRAALADNLDDTATSQVHHRLAEALDARPASDVEQVYAIARHRVAAGADPQGTYRACVTAGHAALNRQAPVTATGFFRDATAAASTAGIELDVAFREAYATALLRAGDFADASDQVTQALAAEQDNLRRAELCDLLATIQHSVGNGEEAVVWVRRGLAELGGALPQRTPLLVVSTLIRLVAGLLVRMSRRRFGTTVGAQRRRAEIEATLLDTGAQAAGVAGDLPIFGIFVMRGVLPVNRIGTSPQRARVLTTLGLMACIAGASRPGLRLCAAGEQEAARVGDPALTGAMAWVQSSASAIADPYHNTIAETVERHARWLDLPDYLMAIGFIVPELINTGYTATAELWIARARKRLRSGASPRDAFPVECSAAAVEAVHGRAAAAEAHLRRALDAMPDTATAEQKLHVASARLVMLAEQGEFGDPFDDVAGQFDATKVSANFIGAQTALYTVAYGRLSQAHAACHASADDAERARRLAQAYDAVRAMRRGRKLPRLRAGRLAFRAWLLHLSGDDPAALWMLHRALRAADGADAPLLSFDIGQLHARILRSLGHEAEAQRQARCALLLAVDHGWAYRAQIIRQEFGIRERLDSSRHSGSSRRGSVGSSSSGQSTVHQRRRLEAVTQVSATAASVLDPEELIDVALDVTLRLLTAERAFLFLAEQGTGTDDAVLLPHRGCDAGGKQLRELTNYSSTLVEQVWRTGESLVVTGSEQGAALGSESAVIHGLRSILVAPLQLKGRRLGVIYLDSRVARGIFTAEHVDLLATITQQMAAALETARAAQLETAMHAANRRRDLAETLRASMADLNSTLDPHEVLRRLLRTMTATLPGDDGVLLRVEPDPRRVMAVVADDIAAGGPAEPTAGADAAASTGQQVPVALGAHGAVELHADAALDALMDAGAPFMGRADRPTSRRLPGAVSALLGDPRSWLVVPLVQREESAGVIIVGAPDSDSFSDVDVEIAGALAEQGAVAHDNAHLFSRVRELATTDGLTGLATRRHFWQLAEQQLAAASRHERALTAMMLDIDHFKAVNDTYGHAAGDAVLRAVARRLRGVLRDADIVGRYGGEEFAMILPETEDASVLAERLRAAVANTDITTDHGPIHVTISVGVSRLRPGDDLDSLLGRADAALYRSKAEGRNQVTLSDPSPAA